MLYTRFVIGEETLQFLPLRNLFEAYQFIHFGSLILGINGYLRHVDITSGWREHQVRDSITSLVCLQRDDWNTRADSTSEDDSS